MILVTTVLVSSLETLPSFWFGSAMNSNGRRNDPGLGNDCYGQRVRHCFERMCYQHKRLQYVKDDGVSGFCGSSEGPRCSRSALGGKEHYTH